MFMNTITKLSEAIRVGSIGVKQGFGSRSLYSDTSPCVLGMARIALGIESNVYETLKEKFPYLRDDYVKERHGSLPEDIIDNLTPSSSSLLSVCWLLNDAAKQTPDQIADWVESIEKDFVEKDLLS